MSATISGDGWVIDMVAIWDDADDDGRVTWIPVEPVTVLAGDAVTIAPGTVTVTAGDDW